MMVTPKFQPISRFPQSVSENFSCQTDIPAELPPVKASDIFGSRDENCEPSSCNASVDSPATDPSDEDVPYKRCGPIETFVFLDLETSGLCSGRQRITEMAMVAVSREDIVQMQRTSKRLLMNRIQAPDKYPSFSGTRSAIPREISKSSVKRRLFGDEFKEIQVTDTHHPHMVGKRLKALELKSKSNIGDASRLSSDSEQLSDDNLSNNDAENDTTHETANTDLSNICHGSSDLSTEGKVTIAACRDVATQTAMPSTSSFFAMPKMPRIIQKMSKVFSPRALIFTDTEEYTGLNNMMLENQCRLDSDFCDFFKLFLKFPQPICLVGHNAVRFDFPIILAEFLSATDCQFQCPDVYCADSLNIFKILDNIEVHEEIQHTLMDMKNQASWIEDDDVFDYVPLQKSSPSLVDRPVTNDCSENVQDSYLSRPPGTPVHSSAVHNNNFTPVSPVTPSFTAPICTSASISSPQRTPAKGSVTGTPPHTPVRVSAIPAHQRETPVTSASKYTPNTRHSSSNIPVKAPTLLKFPENCSFKSKIHLANNHSEYNLCYKPSQKAFSQPILYERLFGKSYVAHRAENDCEALLRIAGHFGDQFCVAADVLKTPFSAVKPAWLTNRMINSQHFRPEWR